MWPLDPPDDADRDEPRWAICTDCRTVTPYDRDEEIPQGPNGALCVTCWQTRESWLKDQETRVIAATIAQRIAFPEDGVA